MPIFVGLSFNGNEQRRVCDRLKHKYVHNEEVLHTYERKVCLFSIFYRANERLTQLNYGVW